METLTKKISKKYKFKAYSLYNINRIFLKLKDNDKLSDYLQNYKSKIKLYKENNYSISIENIIFTYLNYKLKLKSSDGIILLIRFFSAIFTVNLIDVCIICKLLGRDIFIKYDEFDYNFLSNNLNNIKDIISNDDLIINLLNLFLFVKFINDADNILKIIIYINTHIDSFYSKNYNIWIRKNSQKLSISIKSINIKYAYFLKNITKYSINYLNFTNKQNDLIKEIAYDDFFGESEINDFKPLSLNKMISNDSFLLSINKNNSFDFRMFDFDNNNSFL